MPIPFLPAILGALKTAGTFASTKAVPWLAKNILPMVLEGLTGKETGTTGAGGQPQTPQLESGRGPINLMGFPSMAAGNTNYGEIIAKMLAKNRMMG